MGEAGKSQAEALLGYTTGLLQSGQRLRYFTINQQKSRQCSVQLNALKEITIISFSPIHSINLAGTFTKRCFIKDAVRFYTIKK